MHTTNYYPQTIDGAHADKEKRVANRSLVRFTKIFFVIVWTSFLFVHCEKGPPKRRISLSGCSIGGAAYQIAAGQAKIFNTEMDNVLASVEATGCGVDSTILNNANKVDFGSAANGVVYQAYRGIGRFTKKKYTNIRGWVPCYQLPLHIVVLQNKRAKTLTSREKDKCGDKRKRQRGGG